ncbi:hypothetical protein DBZ36_03125 [Alginatibacterium sediminis]|uniref:Uncharacterized protein n=1 Tax=Alginatibacterium sediminis TaxID=2164068 RepID=A0A420EFK0_9ALTE|nr:hypothetical protein DBZ36_03125 [Alginatibacterium sediminis]
MMFLKKLSCSKIKIWNDKLMKFINLFSKAGLVYGSVFGIFFLAMAITSELGNHSMGQSEALNIIPVISAGAVLIFLAVSTQR